MYRIDINNFNPLNIKYFVDDKEQLILDKSVIYDQARKYNS